MGVLPEIAAGSVPAQQADGVETGNFDCDKSRAVAVAHGVVGGRKGQQAVCGVHLGAGRIEAKTSYFDWDKSRAVAVAVAHGVVRCRKQHLAV